MAELTADHKATMEVVIAAMRLLRCVDLGKALSNASEAHTLGPMLNPTLYRDKGQVLVEDEAMMRAALPLWEFTKKLEANERQL